MIPKITRKIRIATKAIPNITLKVPLKTDLKNPILFFWNRLAFPLRVGTLD